MSNVPKIFLQCRNGPCLSETGAMFVGKSAFDGTLFLNNCCRKKYSCKIRKLVGCVSRDKPCRSVTNRDKPWQTVTNRDVDQKLYLNARHCRKIAWRTVTRRDGLYWSIFSRNVVVNNVSGWLMKNPKVCWKYLRICRNSPRVCQKVPFLEMSWNSAKGSPNFRYGSCPRAHI